MPSSTPDRLAAPSRPTAFDTIPVAIASAKYPGFRSRTPACSRGHHDLMPVTLSMMGQLGFAVKCPFGRPGRALDPAGQLPPGCVNRPMNPQVGHHHDILEGDTVKAGRRCGPWATTALRTTVAARTSAEAATTARAPRPM